MGKLVLLLLLVSTALAAPIAVPERGATSLSPRTFSGPSRGGTAAIKDAVQKRNGNHVEHGTGSNTDDGLEKRSPNPTGGFGRLFGPFGPFGVGTKAIVKAATRRDADHGEHDVAGHERRSPSPDPRGGFKFGGRFGGFNPFGPPKKSPRASPSGTEVTKDTLEDRDDGHIEHGVAGHERRSPSPDPRGGFKFGGRFGGFNPFGPPKKSPRASPSGIKVTKDALEDRDDGHVEHDVAGHERRSPSPDPRGGFKFGGRFGGFNPFGPPKKSPRASPSGTKVPKDALEDRDDSHDHGDEQPGTVSRRDTGADSDESDELQHRAADASPNASELGSADDDLAPKNQRR